MGNLYYFSNLMQLIIWKPPTTLALTTTYLVLGFGEAYLQTNKLKMVLMNF